MVTLLEQFKADALDTLFDTECGFAVERTYTPYNWGPLTVRVIFNPEDFVPAPYGEGLGRVDPEALIKTVDVPKAGHKDTVVIDDVTYQVIRAVPDGAGITVLTLNKIG